MKGILFNLLEEVVAQEHGDDLWDELLGAARLEGVYTSLGSYPDSDLFGLFAALAERRGESAAQVQRWFGRRALPRLAARYPAFLREPRSTEELLLTLNQVIHAEVRKIYPGVEVPLFEVAAPLPRVMLLAYRAQRGLCSLAEGLIEGAADHFGETVAVEQHQCVERGDAQCLIRIAFTSAELAADGAR